MLKIGSFWGQNDVIGLNFRVGRKYFFLKTVPKIIVVRFIIITVVRNVLNEGQYGETRSFLMKMIKIGSF